MTKEVDSVVNWVVSLSLQKSFQEQKHCYMGSPLAFIRVPSSSSRYDLCPGAHVRDCCDGICIPASFLVHQMGYWHVAVKLGLLCEGILELLIV